MSETTPPSRPLIATLSGSRAACTWRLTGPAGSDLDAVVAFLILGGHAVDPIKAGASYRVAGHGGTLKDWADQFAAKTPALKLEPETPTPGSIDIVCSVDRGRAWRRAIHIQGDGAAHAHVARAVDMGLRVAAAGLQRWAITGPAATLAAWLARCWGRPVSDVLALWNVTADALASEDNAAPTVNVQLPDRQTTSEVERDAAGLIARIVQTETDMPEPEPAP